MTKAHLSEEHPAYVQIQKDTEFTTLLAPSHRSHPCSPPATKTLPRKPNTTNTADDSKVASLLQFGIFDSVYASQNFLAL